MAPIKFEEQLKDKLEKRRIKPSDAAWDTLSHRLDQAEGKQKNKGAWWVGIAATLVGVLLTLTFVFKSNTELLEPTLVDTDTENQIDTEVLHHQDILKKDNAVAAEKQEDGSLNTMQSETIKKEITDPPFKSVIKEKQTGLVFNKSDQAVAEINTKLKEEESTKNSLDKKNEVLDH